MRESLIWGIGLLVKSLGGGSTRSISCFLHMRSKVECIVVGGLVM